MGSPIIWSGSSAKLLKPILDFFGQAQIHSGTIDPSSVATSAPRGSLYLNVTNGNTYKKTDNGLSTNWTIMANSGSWSVDTFSGTGSQTAFTLSSAPGSVNNMFVSISGVLQLRATYSVSGTTLTFTEAPPLGINNIDVAYGASVTIGVPSDGSVTAAKMGTASVGTTALIDGSVTKAKLAARGQVISSAINFSTTSTSIVQITNASITITTNGAPVILGFYTATGATGFFQVQNGAASSASANLHWFKGGSSVTTTSMVTNTGSGVAAVLALPVGAVTYFDVPVAGTYTYELRVNCASGTSFQAQNMVMFAYEL